MGKEGSNAGFILGLVGGIIGVLVGLQMMATTFIWTWGKGFLGQDSPISSVLEIFGLGFYFIILSMLIIYGSVWMKKDISLRKGSFMALVCGILTLNVIAVIGGIVGLVKK